MPELIALYEDHAGQRDRFEVFAIHDPSVKSFAELDKKLAGIKRQYWQGKDLPFPILLDGAGTTAKLYGIHSWPTGLLIDPSGRLVGEAGVAALEEKLPRLPASRIWSRRRDIAMNVFWSLEPRDTTLAGFARILRRWIRCEVEMDAEAVKACGLNPDGPLPGVVIGGPLTLRSLEQLLLAPHGLGIVPSADEAKLLITHRLWTGEAESYLQRQNGKDLTERLDHRTTAGPNSQAKPLDIRKEPLLAAIKLVGRAFDLPVGLEAKAMQNGTIDPEAKVSGSIVPDNLRGSLTRMLNPLGLTITVRDEVILVIPKSE
ncbi:MAG: TlpA family protein disulfide reductase [Limisphaerales bacterium]